MIALALTFVWLTIVAGAFALWLNTKGGKKWLENLG